MRLLVLVGCVLLLPSLAHGFLSDDHLLLAELEGAFGSARSPFWLYDIIPTDPGERARRLAAGLYPWWSAEGLALNLTRPLASALFALDHLALGRAAWAYHVHALLWLGLLLGAFARLLDRLCSRRVALLALLVLCLDDAHGLPSSWLANRHALIASALAFWGFEAQLAYHERRVRRLLWAATLLYSAALLASEFALSCLAFPATFALLDREHASAVRARRALPWLAPTLLYLALYALLGRGAHGSAAYVSPLEVPAFMAALGTRLPALLADLVLNVPSILWFMGGPVRVVLALLSVTGVALLAWLFGRASEAHRRERSRALPALALGAALALLPTATALPGNRQLLAASFGLAPLLATLLLEAHAAFAAGARASLRTGAAALLAFAHLGFAPLWLLSGQLDFHATEQRVRHIARSLDAIPGCVAPDVDVVLLAAPDHALGVYTPLVRWSLGLAPSRSFRMLSMAPVDHAVSVTDAHTLALSAAAPGFLSSDIERFWRREPLAPGEARRVGPMEVTVLAEREVRFRFTEPLTSAHLCFVRFTGERFERVRLTPGARLSLPKLRGPSGL